MTPSSIRDKLNEGGCHGCVIDSDTRWRCPEYGKACVFEPLCGDNKNNDTYEDCDYQLKHLDSRCDETTCLFKYNFTYKTHCHWPLWHGDHGPFPCCISYYNNITNGQSDTWNTHSPDYHYWRDNDLSLVLYIYIYIYI